MAQTFFPKKSIKVSTTRKNIFHIVSIGHEIGENNDPGRVLKVQVQVNGKLSGKRSASYHVGSGEFFNMLKAALTLIREETPEIFKSRLKEIIGLLEE